ncbi:MAG: hypothetical protein NTY24_03770 [Mycobacterium sp.]|nr:hypothetical protein [Mycobacterium sp.]
MRIVVALAVAALVALIAALVTGSTAPAIAVVGLAGAGIVVLLRDWRADSPPADSLPGDAPASDAGGAPRAGDFSPDISTAPDGPSSDARADQL